uniref:Uncharacterized protein n=1 Tax=Rhizophora mucronata TaxID=61149 RepID=A0A2P2KA90_RHIMU
MKVYFLFHWLNNVHVMVTLSM